MGRKALLIVMLVSAFGCKAMTELKEGRCKQKSDCKADQVCENSYCVTPDSGSAADTLISQSDTPVFVSDTATPIDSGERTDAAVVVDAESVDAPVVDASVVDTAVIGCKTAADCTGPRSHCVANVCVECEGPEDCKDPGKAFCAGGACVSCEQAGSNACVGKVCAPAGTPDAGGQCVECLTSVHCKEAAAPVCEGNACVGCTSGEQCKAKNKETPACLTTAGACVGCVSKADCPLGVPECDTTSHTCVGCTNSLGCLSGTPICTGGVCGKCVVSSQCSERDPGTPICDSGACVQCSNNSDCKDPSKSNCDPATKTCVGCLTHQNCTGATPICDGNTCKSCTTATKTCKDRDAKLPACAGGGSCVECTEKDATACTGKKSMCNTKSSLCVQCLDNSDCGDTTPICSNNTCVACGSAAECKAKDAAFPACVSSGAQAGRCVLCTDNTTCSNGQVCKTETNACVQCLADRDCTDPTQPICDIGTNTCGKCASAEQCTKKNAATPVCLGSGACVQCQGNSDCSGTSPICESNACRRCDYKNDSECVGIGPGVCMPDGHCATDAETYPITTGGTFPSLTGMTGKNLLVITGTVTGSLALDFTLAGRSQPVTVVGKNAGVISGGGGLRAVHVSGGEVFIKDLTISNSGSVGILADKSNTLHLEKVTVQNNQGIGIQIDASHFDINNTTVAANGSLSAGIGFANLASVTTAPKSIAHTTVTGNGTGVLCNAAADAPVPAPTSVLVYNNGGGGEIASNCNFTSCGANASAKSATCGAP